MAERVKEFQKNPVIAQKSTFDFEKDFYGKQGFYACKNGIGTRIMAFVFGLIYKPYKFSIDLHIYFNKLEMLNTFVIFKKKQYQKVITNKERAISEGYHQYRKTNIRRLSSIKKEQ